MSRPRGKRLRLTVQKDLLFKRTLVITHVARRGHVPKIPDLQNIGPVCGHTGPTARRAVRALFSQKLMREVKKKKKKKSLIRDFRQSRSHPAGTSGRTRCARGWMRVKTQQNQRTRAHTDEWRREDGVTEGQSRDQCPQDQCPQDQCPPPDWSRSRAEGSVRNKGDGAGSRAGSDDLRTGRGQAADGLEPWRPQAAVSLHCTSGFCQNLFGHFEEEPWFSN